MHRHLDTPIINSLRSEAETLFRLRREIRQELERYPDTLSRFITNAAGSNVPPAPTDTESSLLALASMHTIIDVILQDRQRRLDAEVHRLNKLRGKGA